eukprot:12601238-Heterocapsa_arctica.AAC.1
MYFADKAGTLGANFAQYALAPLEDGSSGSEGRFQKHLDSVLPASGPFYPVDTPVSEKRAVTRDRRCIPTNPFHEALYRE